MTTEAENKTERVQLLMTPSEVKAIDDWGFSNRIRTRAEAIRRLCQIGIVFDESSDQIELTSNIVASKLNEFSKLTKRIYEETTTAEDAANISFASFDMFTEILLLFHEQSTLISNTNIIGKSYKISDDFDKIIEQAENIKHSLKENLDRYRAAKLKLESDIASRKVEKANKQDSNK